MNLLKNTLNFMMPMRVLFIKQQDFGCKTFLNNHVLRAIPVEPVIKGYGVYGNVV